MRPVVVIGGGILGLAVAEALRVRFPDGPLVLLEKEAEVARHQTGHNSGVIHSGLYYRPGSLKAQLCLAGRARLIELLRTEGLPFEPCGKLVVATGPAEVPRLEELQRRGIANGVPGLVRLGPEGIREREPEARGVAGLWVPGTAITDYRAVCGALRQRLERAGVEVRTSEPVIGADRLPGGLRLTTPRGDLDARYAVNCAGLESDRIARLLGDPPPVRIVPFRGEYYRLPRSWYDRLHGLVYPVPDPDLPFLGVHLTRTVDGGVEVGPNAVLALAREGYHRTDFRLRDAVEPWTDPGFLRAARKFLRTGFYEQFRSLDRATYARDVQRLVPGIRALDLGAGGSGVRAQAVDPAGTLCDDFVFGNGPAALHVLNAPSPGATSSLAIGDYVAARVPAPT